MYTKETISDIKLSSKKAEKKLHKTAVNGERMLTSSEAEDILNKILSEYLFQVNLN